MANNLIKNSFVQKQAQPSPTSQLQAHVHLVGQGQDDHNDSERIEKIISIIYQADDQENSGSHTKKMYIQKLADEIEKIMVRKGYPEEKVQICTLICDRFRKDKRPWLQWSAIKTLDSNYKWKNQNQHQEQQQQQKEMEESSMRLLEDSSNLPEESSIIESENMNFLNQLNNHFDPTEVHAKAVQKMLDATFKFQHKLQQFCNRNGIAFHNPHSQKSTTDEINDNADAEFDETISELCLPVSVNEVIRAIDSDAFDDSILLADDIRRWAELQRKKTPSQTIDQAMRWRDATTALRLIMRQAIDGKARRSMTQWAHIDATLAQHGGTAASSKSAMPVLNPKTGTELIDPKTGRQVFRTITKEQIDSRGERYASEIDFMVHQLVWTDMVEERFAQLTCGLRDYRATSAHEKLSRKA